VIAECQARLALPSRARDALCEGDRVEAGDPGTEEYDEGNVLRIDGDRAAIGWESGVRTWNPVADLRRI
jgi:hypothetical protein